LSNRLDMEPWSVHQKFDAPIRVFHALNNPDLRNGTTKELNNTGEMLHHPSKSRTTTQGSKNSMR